MWTFDDLERLHERLLTYDVRISSSAFAAHWKQIRRVVEEHPHPAPSRGSLMYLTDCARMICETFDI